MRTLLTTTLLFLFTSLNSQKLIPDADKIKAAFDKLSADTNNKELQAKYVAAFPSDSGTFSNVFQTIASDRLYSGYYKYLQVVEMCATSFPKEVIGKCIDLGKNLTWDADAIGQLQTISVSIATKYLTEFIGKFNTLTQKEQDKLINFYADVENHNAFPAYEYLIEQLSLNGQKNTSKRLEIARAKRKQMNDH
jgi:hypothetical protein